MMTRGSVFGIAAFCCVVASGMACAGDKEVTGGLAVRSSLDTIFADGAPQPEANRIIALRTAQRESESAQIAVIAGQEQVSVTDVTSARLAHVNGQAWIDAEHVRTELVGYVAIRENSWRGWKRLGLWPDVLMPMRAFETPAGECRLIWATICTPADATPGDYSGQITVHYGDGSSACIDLSLHVYNFALPETPTLKTSYWTAIGSAYPGGLSDQRIARKLFDLFGAYRTSTDVWAGVRYYREPDGAITADSENTRRNIEYAAGVAGFNTLNIGSGCWGGAPFADPTIHDRQTGKPLSKEQLRQIGKQPDLMKLYLNQMCDWLESKGWLDRAYLQLWDEPARDTWAWGARKAYPSARAKEPRLRLLSVVGVHPDLQGLFDIWVPNLSAAFYDQVAYQQVRQGISLRRQKNFPAQVTASSTGGWGNAAFYKYLPIDAYDGCDYTKWTPETEPTQGARQWLRFDFEQPVFIDGIRIVPYGSASADIKCAVELSADGNDLTPVTLTPRPGMANSWSFDPGTYKAIRLVHEKLPVAFKATDEQPLPTPDGWPAGVREVEFLRQGLALESTLPRPRDQRPCEVWEYNVGADWPSVCIDARPHEHRATGWLMWLHGSEGYLNYGGAQWQKGHAGIDMEAVLAGEPPLVWEAGGNGSPNIIWPGRDGPLASIRFARFRDGIDDYDYLTILAQTNPDHPLIQGLRRRGRAIAMDPESIFNARNRAAEAIETARLPWED